MQSFDLVASLYDFVNRSRYKRDTEVALHWLGLKSGMNFLDIGGGTGAMANLIYRKTGCEITVVDPSSGMMAIGNEKGHRAKWVQASPDKFLPFKANSADGIVMVYTLHHIRKESQLKALVEITRVLKKGSKLLLIEMDYHNMLSIAMNLSEKLMTAGQVWFLSPKELQAFLNKAGLDVLHLSKRSQGYILCAIKS